MSGNSAKNKKSHDAYDFESELVRAMISRGWLIPRTEDEVVIAEKLAPGDVLIFSTAKPVDNPRAQNQDKTAVSSAAPALQNEIQENLAYAARNGKEISSEVRELMRKDRETAEGEQDGER